MSRSRIVSLTAISIVVFALVAGCGSVGSKVVNETNAAKPVTEVTNAKVAVLEVSVDEALTLWQNKQATIIDVRTPAEYQAGHVPGVANIPLEELESRMSEVPKDKQVLLICRSGNRSGKGTKMLRDKGWDNVYNVSEGMLGWKGPVEK